MGKGAVVELSYFLKGVVLGFSVAAPVGPIGLQCIRKTIQYGRLSGLFSGMGAAVADMLFAIVAAFGITLVSDFVLASQFWLRLAGGALLVLVGVRTYRTQPKLHAGRISHKTLAGDFASTFTLTIANPMIIFAYLAIFAGLGLTPTQGDVGGSASVVAGVFCGSALWWLMLSEGVALFRRKITVRGMKWINRSAGLLILACGLGIGLSVLF